MFSVLKDAAVMSEIGQAWLHADEDTQVAMHDSMHSIEKKLQKKPLECGESREGSERIIFKYPIAVNYVVNCDSRVVRMTRVWTYTRPKKEYDGGGEFGSV